MKLFDLFTKSSFAAILVAMAFVFQPNVATAQSTDESHPTPIAGFPVTGNLGTGTYYYELPESLVAGGPATAVLDLTLPDGGGSMTVTFSGRLCCPPEAYIGVSTGVPDRRRETTTFNIPRQLTLLVTVYIHVGAKQTISYRLNFTNGTPRSGVVVTPPPLPTPPTPDVPVCTDLALDFFSPSTEGSTRRLRGNIRNLTTTHPYKGFPRRQWLEALDITDSETPPRLVARFGIPKVIDPGAAVPYTMTFNVTDRIRRRYEVRIVYSDVNATDASKYNDDCNSSNNSTRRQLIAVPTDPPETP